MWRQTWKFNPDADTLQITVKTHLRWKDNRLINMWSRFGECCVYQNIVIWWFLEGKRQHTLKFWHQRRWKSSLFISPLVDFVMVQIRYEKSLFHVRISWLTLIAYTRNVQSVALGQMWPVFNISTAHWILPPKKKTKNNSIWTPALSKDGVYDF